MAFAANNALVEESKTVNKVWPLVALCCVLTNPHVLKADAASAEDARAEAAARALLISLVPATPVDPQAPVPALDPARLAPRRSLLGIPSAPKLPKLRVQFDFPAEDPAGDAARSIAQRVASFPNFRAQAPGAAWREDKRARFALRSTNVCLGALQDAGVRAHPLARELTTPVATPVVIDAPIEGVAFVSLHADREIEVSCELALRLKSLARILKAHGVLAVGINSSYRDRPKVSFHTFGLALDMMAFRTKDQTLVVAEHFEVSADSHTCEATPSTAQGKALLALVCAIADSHAFSTILTPNYNEGHRDHVHLDARPDDPRVFVR
jgi:hypothetical protein